MQIFIAHDITITAVLIELGFLSFECIDKRFNDMHREDYLNYDPLCI